MPQVLPAPEGDFPKKGLGQSQHTPPALAPSTQARLEHRHVQDWGLHKQTKLFYLLRLWQLGRRPSPVCPHDPPVCFPGPPRRTLTGELSVPHRPSSTDSSPPTGPRPQRCWERLLSERTSVFISPQPGAACWPSPPCSLGPGSWSLHRAAPRERPLELLLSNEEGAWVSPGPRMVLGGL